MLKWFLLLICVVLALAFYSEYQKVDDVKSELHSTQTELQTAQTQVAQLTRQLQQIKSPKRAKQQPPTRSFNPFPNNPLNQPAHSAN